MYLKRWKDKKGVSVSCLDDISLKATTEIKAFDSMLTVYYGSGQHQLIVGLDGLKESIDSEIDVTKNENRRARGCPQNTYHVENCSINFYAHHMIQILGLG